MNKRDYINNYVYNNNFKVYFHSNIYDQIPQKKVYDGKVACTRALAIPAIINKKKRILHFPNIFAYNHCIYKMASDIEKIEILHDTAKINLKDRRFEKQSYKNYIQKISSELIYEYDCCYKFDIKSFYNSIYTHIFEHLENTKNSGFTIDQNIRFFNGNKTKGILLGNIASFKVANIIMDQIVKEYKNKLYEEYERDFKVNFFSDQIYVYIENKRDVKFTEALHLLESVLEKEYYEFQINYEDSITIDKNFILKENKFQIFMADIKQTMEDTSKIYISSKKIEKLNIVQKINKIKLIAYINDVIEFYRNDSEFAITEEMILNEFGVNIAQNEIDVINEAIYNAKKSFYTIRYTNTFKKFNYYYSIVEDKKKSSFANYFLTKIFSAEFKRGKIGDNMSTIIVDTLFYILLEHPNLVEIYIEKEIFSILSYEFDRTFNNKEKSKYYVDINEKMLRKMKQKLKNNYSNMNSVYYYLITFCLGGLGTGEITKILEDNESNILLKSICINDLDEDTVDIFLNKEKKTIVIKNILEQEWIYSSQIILNCSEAKFDEIKDCFINISFESKDDYEINRKKNLVENILNTIGTMRTNNTNFLIKTSEISSKK